MGSWSASLKNLVLADGVEFAVVCTTTFVAPSTAENSQNLLCMIDFPNFGSPRQDLFVGHSCTKDGLARLVPNSATSCEYTVLSGRSVLLVESSRIWTRTPRSLARFRASTIVCSHTW